MADNITGEASRQLANSSISTLTDFDELVRSAIWGMVDMELVIQSHRNGRKSQLEHSVYQISSLTIECPPSVCHIDYWSSSLFFLRHFNYSSVQVKTSILDVGTGCGIIPLAISKLSRNNPDIVGLDISSIAISSARKNAERNGIAAKFVVSDLFANLPKSCFDIVVFNPPLLNREPEDQIDATIFCDPEAKLLGRFVDQVKSVVHKDSIAYVLMSNIGSAKPIESWRAKKEIAGLEFYSNGEIRVLLKISDIA